MSLVNELQESAGQDDVLTVLRKAKRVSSKLGRKDISEWLRREQNGYSNDADVPGYRHVTVSFYYRTNGYIPAGFGYLQNGIAPIPGFTQTPSRPVTDSISTIMAWIRSMDSGKGIYQPLNDKASAIIRDGLDSNFPEILDQLTFLAKIEESGLRDIPEQVKDRILEWACDLEAAGVTGEGQSFSSKEKEEAQRVVFNIQSCTIDQLNASGDNLKHSS